MAAWGTILTRAWIASFALVGALWSGSALPSFYSLTLAQAAIDLVISGAHFKPDLVAQSLAKPSRYFEAFKHPDFARARALVALRTNDEARTYGCLTALDCDGEPPLDKARSALMLNPADSYLWLLFYAATITDYGFDRRSIGLLDQSYATSPLDGWIVIRRIRTALSVFSMLEPETQEKVISEFRALVGSGLIDDAASNLEGVGWVQRDRLLDSLKETDIGYRESLARKLARDGIVMNVPGVDQDERWWR